MLVHCPSGLVIDLRKLKVQEMNILADKQAQQKGVVLDSLLNNLWTATQDPGPYTFTDRPLWDDVLVGDRYYALLQSRCATHGPEFDFKVQCAVCRAAIDWTINLDELPKKMLDPRDADVFRAGNAFEDLGPSGKKVAFHLMTGRHEKKAQQILKSNRTSRVTASLLARIDSIEGVTDRARYIDDLDMGEAMELIAMLDSHDCGIETTFEVQCTECDAVSEVMLPLDQGGFWRPPKKATKTSIAV
jgi:hypothetical protein